MLTDTNAIEFIKNLNKRHKFIKRIDVDFINKNDELKMDNLEIEIAPTTNAVNIKDLRNDLAYENIYNYRVFYTEPYTDEDGFENYYNECVIEEYHEDAPNTIARFEFLKNHRIALHYSIPGDECKDSSGLDDDLWLDPRFEQFLLTLGYNKPDNIVLVKTDFKTYIRNALDVIEKCKFESTSGTYDTYLRLSPKINKSKIRSEFFISTMADYEDAYRYPIQPEEGIRFPLSFSCKKKNVFPRFEDRIYEETLSELDQELFSIYIYEEIIKPMGLHDSYEWFKMRNSYSFFLLIDKPIDWENVKIIETPFEKIVLEEQKVVAAIHNGSGLEIKTEKFIEKIKEFCDRNL